MSPLLWILIVTQFSLLSSYVLDNAQRPLALEDDHRDSSSPRTTFSPLSESVKSPCGSFVDDTGIWHLYYQQVQNVQDDDDQGNISWGHATSTNLYNWSVQKVAIPSNSHGPVLGGSAVIDAENTSGLFLNQDDGVVAFYTQTVNGENRIKASSSIDGGYTFDPAELNLTFSVRQLPVRDPQVTWDSTNKTWVMLVSTLQEPLSLFFTSSNLLDWKLSDEIIFSFRGTPKSTSLARVPVNNAKGYSHIVTWSYEKSRPSFFDNTMYYYLGDWDGAKFTPFHPENGPTPLTVDSDTTMTHFFTNTPTDTPLISLSFILNENYLQEGQPNVLTIPRAHHLLNASKPDHPDSYTLITQPYNLPAVIPHGPFLSCPGPGSACGGNTGHFPSYIRANFTYHPPLKPFTDTATQKTALLTFTAGQPEESFGERIAASFTFGAKHTDPVEFRLAWENVTATRPITRHSVEGDFVTDPSVPGARHWDMEVVMDEAVVEVYLNGGRDVLAMSYFSEERLEFANWDTGWGLPGLEVEYRMWLIEGGGVRREEGKDGVS